MFNVVIPMAGRGSRFSALEEETPKPYVDVNGKPMFIRVIENFLHPEANFILIARDHHVEAEFERVKAAEKKYDAQVITIDNLTEGTVCTALFAREKIYNDTPLLIVMADQIIDFDLNEFLADCEARELDGSLVCFKTKKLSLKYSYAKLDEKKMVSQVKEKEVISDIVTAGIYYFSKGKHFVDAAIDMIIRNDRVNNEFYVAPVYNYLIPRTKKIGVFMINHEQAHDLGTQKKLNKYLNSSESGN